MKIERRAAAASLLGQAAVILLLVWLFACGGALTYYRTGGLSLPVAMVPVAVGVCLVAALVGWGLLGQPKLGAGLRQKGWLLLLFVLLVALRLPQWGTLLQDDGYTYYSKLAEACRTFSFDPSYLFDNFRLANHPTWGLALLAAIPAFFMPENTNSFFVFQIAVSLAACGCLYDLLRRLPGVREGTAFLGALAFGCSPMFLGMASYPSLEVGLSAFFFCMVWAYSRRYYLLLLFTCILTVTSKEFGIVLVFGFFVGAFLGEWRLHGGQTFGRRLWAVLRTPRIGLFCLVGLVMGVAILVYLSTPGMAWFNLRDLFRQDPNNSLIRIGWSWTYSLYKVQELVFVNFDWLLLAVILLCLVGRRLRRAAALDAESVILLLGTVLGGVMYLFFSCLAMTYSLPRYSMVTELILAFCAVVLLVQTVRVPAGEGILVVLSLVLAVQGYLCVDPVMKGWFPAVDTGAVSMARVGHTGGRHMGDYMVYNYQYSYLRKGLQDVFTQYDPAAYDFVVLDQDGWYYLTYLHWDYENRTFLPEAGETTTPVREYQTDETRGNAVSKALQEGALQSRAVITWSPTYAADTPTVEQARTMVPDCYTNLEQHVWDAGLAGKMVYFTADLQQE